MDKSTTKLYDYNEDALFLYEPLTDLNNSDEEIAPGQGKKENSLNQRKGLHLNDSACRRNWLSVGSFGQHPPARIMKRKRSPRKIRQPLEFESCSDLKSWPAPYQLFSAFPPKCLPILLPIRPLSGQRLVLHLMTSLNWSCLTSSSPINKWLIIDSITLPFKVRKRVTVGIHCGYLAFEGSRGNFLRGSTVGQSSASLVSEWVSRLWDVFCRLLTTLWHRNIILTSGLRHAFSCLQ